MDAAAENTMPPPVEVKGGLVAYLMVDGAVKATEVYARALGAEVATILPPDEAGRTMHAHLYINGSSLMLSDPYPEHGCPVEKPQGFNLTLQVTDIDAWWARAVEGGFEEVMPLQTMFWNARYGQLRDPFGIIWALNQPL